MTERQTYDLAVIGAGPGGYVAAIKAAQNKHQVCPDRKTIHGRKLSQCGLYPNQNLLANGQVMAMVQAAADMES